MPNLNDLKDYDDMDDRALKAKRHQLGVLLNRQQIDLDLYRMHDAVITSLLELRHASDQVAWWQRAAARREGAHRELLQKLAVPVRPEITLLRWIIRRNKTTRRVIASDMFGDKLALFETLCQQGAVERVHTEHGHGWRVEVTEQGLALASEKDEKNV